MTRYVAFLRAINVGGRRVSMDKLRSIFEELGYQNVETYIASGNVAFDAAGKAAVLEAAIEPQLEKSLGYRVETFVRSCPRLAEIVALDPFPDRRDSDTYMVGFLRKPPAAAQTKAVTALSGDSDQFAVQGSELHWLIHGKTMDSKVGANPLVKALGGEPMTTRNITMLRKLSAKVNA